MPHTIRSILMQKSHPSSTANLLHVPSPQNEPACSTVVFPVTWKFQLRMHKLEAALTLLKETSNLLLCAALRAAA